MGAGLVVGILVARYLGPEQYGKLAYCISMVMLFSAFTHLGLNGLTVRELVRRPSEKERVLGTVLVMKMCAAVVAFIGMLVFSFVSTDGDSVLLSLLLCVAIALLLDPKIAVEFWFESKVQGKYTAIAKTLSLATAAFFKIMLLVIGSSLYWFGFAFLLEAVILMFALFWLYKKTEAPDFGLWRFSGTEAKQLLSRGWMVMVGALCAMIYQKVDQVMLMWMVGAKEVGIYAVAAQLSEAWYFLPVAIVASVYPGLIELKEKDELAFKQRMQSVFDLLFFIAIVLAICTTLLATPLIRILFGEDYLASASVLIIHIWSCCFVFARALFGKWILIQDVLGFSLLTTVFGAISNVALNLWLIPVKGAEGAAYATLISYGVASFLSLAFYSKTRVVFYMMCKAFLVPLRCVTIYKQVRAFAKQ